MPTVWFVIVGCMITAYVLLDGFDLGAGVVYLAVARSDAERRAVIRTIGPVWDGNEVWLLAAGGTLYFAFPQLYASAFSGFYLPLMVVLWLLMLRAMGIEFRSHIRSIVWNGLLDIVFAGSSLLLTVFFGIAFGNVVRGVPLGADGYFFEPLWTNFKISDIPGIIDWYTVVAGLVALCALSMHGALYVAHKTDGDIHRRALGMSVVLWPLLFLITCVSMVATYFVRPDLLDNYRHHPVGYLIPAVVFLALAAILYFAPKGRTKAAFVASCLYLGGMLVGAVYALYPVILPARNPKYSLTIWNSSAGHHGLVVGSIWWTFAAILAVAYFIFVYRMFRGKVQVEPEGKSH